MHKKCISSRIWAKLSSEIRKYMFKKVFVGGLRSFWDSELMWAQIFDSNFLRNWYTCGSLPIYVCIESQHRYRDEFPRCTFGVRIFCLNHILSQFQWPMVNGAFHYCVFESPQLSITIKLFYSEHVWTFLAISCYIFGRYAFYHNFFSFNCDVL